MLYFGIPMDELENNFISTNINSLWLQNIFENLKNLEVYERLAREGCGNLLEYVQLPIEKRQIFLNDVQYKNLRFILTEMHLLLSDLTPVIEKKSLEKFETNMIKLERIINNRKLFVKEGYSATHGAISNSKLTDMFYHTLDFLCSMRQDIIKEISHILYVKSETP